MPAQDRHGSLENETARKYFADRVSASGRVLETCRADLNLHGVCFLPMSARRSWLFWEWSLRQAAPSPHKGRRGSLENATAPSCVDG